MDVITTGILANAAYETLKAGVKISGQELKKRLTRWLIEDHHAEDLSSELNKLEINDGMSEKAITASLNQSQQIIDLLGQIKSPRATAHSTINTVTQHHSGNGDNIAGNKISS
ncbi:hypothetical protein PUR31_05470 [Pseudomonas mosselii]|jgi:hypothetical protein|uniref:GapS6a family protein n=1 Tax=unclassified Pseudomonas TaxID=196821 RepID=UPI0020C2AF32|nr:MULTISPECIES: hypothetical protein [unclassified Pseudomonas]MCP8631724.1 hypothetical protein [Pseudomonas sp. DVZ6]MDC0688731.1 hypothetical protein [Mitsuaria sp. RG]MDD7783541.1 hypothetical protein [Pseudomonas sp. DVZ24]